MFRFLKILIISLLSLVLVTIAVMYWQKDNIIEAAIGYLEDSYDIQLNYDHTELNFFRNWPNIGFEIQDVSIHTDSSPDSLAFMAAEKVGLSLSFWQVWNTPYQLDEVYLNQPTIHLICDSNGICNFDVFVSQNDSTLENSNPTAPFEFTLESLNWNNAQVSYIDEKQKSKFLISDWTAQWFISLLDESLTIDMDIIQSNVSAYQKGSLVLHEVTTTAKGSFYYDLSRESLTFENHMYTLNGLQLNGNGVILNLNQIPDIDWNIEMPSNTIESVLSLFPPAYDTYKNEINTNGTASFQAKISGPMDIEANNYPSLSSAFQIKNGYVKYNAASHAIEDLEIGLKMSKEQGDLTGLEVLIEKLEGKFGSNGSIDHRMHVFPFSRTLTNSGSTQLGFSMSDLYTTLPFLKESKAEGLFNLQGDYTFKMEDVLNENWNNVQINGNLSGNNIRYFLEADRDVTLKEVKAVLENKEIQVNMEDLQYEQNLIPFIDFKGAVLAYILSSANTLTGDLSIKGKMIDINTFIESTTTDEANPNTNSIIELPPMDIAVEFESDELRYYEYDFSGIKTTGIFFGDRFKLSNAQAYYSSTYLQCEGDVFNILNYLNAKGDLQSNFECSADEFDLYAYMSAESLQENNQDQTSAIFRFPELITMDLDYRVGKILYDNIVFENVNGQLGLKNQELLVKPTRMSSLGGDISLQGMVSHKGAEELHYNFDLASNNSKFKSAFESVEMIQSVAPVFKYMFGEFNTQVTIDGDLDQDLAPVLSSISAQGLIETLNAQIREYKLLNKLSTLFDEEVLSRVTFPKTKNWFSIENGMVFLDPTPVILGKEDFIIEGSHQIQGEIDYKLSGPVSISQLKNSSIGNKLWKSVNENLQQFGLNQLPPDAKLNIDIRLTGELSDLSISVLPLDNLQEQLKTIAENKKEKAKEEIKDQIKEETEKLDSLRVKQTEQAKKDAKRELKSLLDSGKTTSRIDSLREEAKKKTEKVKKKFKKWNPFGNE